MNVLEEIEQLSVNFMDDLEFIKTQNDLHIDSLEVINELIIATDDYLNENVRG